MNILTLFGRIGIWFATILTTAMGWLGDLVSAILSAFTDLGTTILNFIKNGFITLFLESTTDATTGAVTITGASPLAIFMFFLCGVSLVIGLTTLIFRLMKNRGNVN